MQECDTLSLGSDPWLLVDELNSGATTTLQGRIEVVDGEANVMNPRSALLQESRDRGFRVSGLQKLHQRLACAEANDVSAVGVIEVDLGQSEHVAKKRQALGEGLDGDPDM